jgi:hypothetical protein
MTTITEAEFARICDGIREDRDSIVKHNPLGTDEEILLWMLLSCLISYLNLSDLETPCFTGVPNAETYRNAVIFVISERRADAFEPDRYLDMLTK